MKTKKISIFVCLLMVAAVFAVAVPMNVSAEEGSEWNFFVVDSSGTIGDYSSLELDSNEYPHISYRCYSYSSVNYAKWTGSEWATEMVDWGGGGMFSSLALDSNDNAHISYWDNKDSELKYAKWTGSEWSLETVDSAGDIGACTSIALDSSDYPHITYWDHTNWAIKYARWTGTEWSFNFVDSSGHIGPESSIAIDSNDIPHVSYRDDSNTDLKYAKWTGSAWSTVTVDSAGNFGRLSSITIDNNDRPHISYLDWGNFDLKYAKWTGSEWSIETADSVGDVGWQTSIALDSADNPHITHYDWGNGDLKYTKWTGSEWSTMTLDSTGSVGWHSSIALDSADNPHISYWDKTNADLKYTTTAELNLAPIANAGSDETVVIGETVTLDGSDSYDPDGTIESYEWDFDDGSPIGTGEIVTHAYDSAGIYTVTLTVEDNNQATDTDTVIITVLTAEEATEEVDDYIQELPEEAFESNAEQLQNALYEKLIENEEGDAVLQLIEAGLYEEALEKLLNDIRPKCDGSVGGNPHNDWITDPEVQAELLAMIDALIEYLETLI